MASRFDPSQRLSTKVIRTYPETPGQAPSLSRDVSWVLLRALHNTQGLQLHVPSEGRSNYGEVSCSRTQASRLARPVDL